MYANLFKHCIHLHLQFSCYILNVRLFFVRTIDKKKLSIAYNQKAYEKIKI